MTARSVSQIFQQYQTARAQFAQAVADQASRPEALEQLLEGNVIHLLNDLLTDVSPGVQQHATLAVGRLAGHDPKIADLLIQQDVLRVLIFFSMDKSNRYLKRTTLAAMRSFVKHSEEHAKALINLGGLNQLVCCLEEFDPGVKEGAAWVLGYIARHSEPLAFQVIAAGAIPLLVLALQEPEINVRQVAVSALSDICRHGPQSAQHVIDAGAIHHFVRATAHTDAKLKRLAFQALAMIAKHSANMMHLVLDQDVLPLALENCSHSDELVRKAASSLVKEVVKHSPELASNLTDMGGLGVLIDAVGRNRGEAKLPGIMSLGFIAGHNPESALGVIYSKGVEVLALSLSDTNPHVACAAAWALGHIAKHSQEHAKHASASGVLAQMLSLYKSSGNSEEMKEKYKSSLKQILVRTDDLTVLAPLITDAPPEILKYVVAQYSKILPQDPAARRFFVTSGGLRKLQELLSSGAAPEGSILFEHINFINQCFPDDVVKYFSPDYPGSLLERVEVFQPQVKMDTSLWTDRLFSDMNVPEDVVKQMQEIQKTLECKDNNPASGPEEQNETDESPGRRKKSKKKRDKSAGKKKNPK